MNTLTGSRWLITGAGGGLGLEIAKCVLERGGEVAGSVRSKEAARRFTAVAPGRAHAVVFDVRDETAVRDGVAEAQRLLGHLDVVVNNAGYQLLGAVEELSLDELRAQFEVNVFGAHSVIKAVLPDMRNRGRGSIVNITSVSGLATWAGTGAYCASKFALEALGQTLAQEVEPLGIRVMHVEPGGLRTGFTNRSTHRAAVRLDAYAGTAHQSEAIIERYRGQEPGDPCRAAAAIVDALRSDEPPLHLLLGNDALFYYGRKAGSLQQEVAKWAPVSTSIAADAVPDG